MKFVNSEKALLTVMLQCETPEVAIGRIKKALAIGGEAFGLQTESLKPEYQNPETYRRIFEAMDGRPVYVTHYRSASNTGKSDDELAQGLLTLAENGATLCDVIGDFFCKDPEELTMDPEAVAKQIKLIDEIHARGAEVIMSSHVRKYIPAERVLEIAMEQQRRGADVVKIVTWGNSMEEQIENLRINWLLKENLKVPFLYLSGGECSLHRRIGGSLGCCMYLCVYEHDEHSTPMQPLLSKMKLIRDNMEL